MTNQHRSSVNTFPMIPDTFTGLQQGEPFTFSSYFTSDLHFTGRGLTAPGRKSKFSHYADVLELQNRLFRRRLAVAKTTPLALNHRPALEFNSLLTIELALAEQRPPSLLDLMIDFP